MGKYNYDGSVLKGLTVFPFLGEVGTRNKHIEAAPDTMPESVFNANRLAAALHPDRQHCKVARVIDRGKARSFILVPDPDKGTESLAFFRAGQYLSVFFETDGAVLSKPYSICSSPKDALGTENTSYMLTIERGTQASVYAHDHWTEGTEVLTSGPLGNYYYQGLRDAKKVVALAGGSGITPFYSMAAAIADGLEDFDLTILYGSGTYDRILLREELDEIAARSNGKVKVVHVLSGEEREGFEHGFITADLIKKYAEAEDYSVFACGPKAMYQFLETELPKLGLPKRRVRFELSGEFGDPAQDAEYPAETSGKTFNITAIHHGGETVTVECRSDQTILQALTNAGCYVQSECRSGQCGWCRSRLVSGEIFTPKSHDGRREADKKFGWIHPCVSYPLSDITMELPQ